MLKSKKSKFILFTILSIVVLLCFIPIIANWDYLFGIKGVENQHIDGDVDVSVTINVELNFGLTYFYYVEFDFTFNESVTDVEVEEIQYKFYHNGVYLYNYSGNYTPNVIVSKFMSLLYRDNLTYQGSIELNYQLNSNPKNDTVNFNTIYTHNIKEQDADAYASGKTAFFLAYIASYFLLPIILFFTIHPDFLELSKEEKERSEDYFNYLEKRKKD